MPVLAHENIWEVYVIQNGGTHSAMNLGRLGFDFKNRQRFAPKHAPPPFAWDLAMPFYEPKSDNRS